MSTGETVATTVYFICVAGSVVFVAGRLRTRFWKYPEGIALLLQHMALVGLGAQTVLALTIGSGQWWQIPLYVLLLGTFTAAVWWLTLLQEQVRREAKRQALADLTAQLTSEESHPLTDDHQLG